jgi:hypothetical protein
MSEQLSAEPPSLPLEIIAPQKMVRMLQRDETRKRLQEEYRNLRTRFDQAMEELDRQDTEDRLVTDQYANLRIAREGKTVQFLLADGSVAVVTARKSPDSVEVDKETALKGVPPDHESGFVHFGDPPLEISKTAWKNWRKKTGEELPGGRLVEGQVKLTWKFHPVWTAETGAEPKQIEEAKDE